MSTIAVLLHETKSLENSSSMHSFITNFRWIKQFSYDLEKCFRLSVRYLFYQRSKHGLFVFPNACGKDTVRLAKNRKKKIEFFHPSIRLTNQKPRAFVSFRRTNQIALFRLFVVSVLFACFYFKVRRKSFSKDCKCIYSRCYSFKGATSRYLLSF